MGKTRTLVVALAFIGGCSTASTTTATEATELSAASADEAGYSGDRDHRDRDDDDAIGKVKHVIVVMQTNHSFDNYFGALGYAPRSPYHNAGAAGCAPGDHRCVDGLSCSVDTAGAFHCTNANAHKNGTLFAAFHNANRCIDPDLKHGWGSGHKEVNFAAPNDSRLQSPMDGFVKVNEDRTETAGGAAGAHEGVDIDETMGFYTQDDLPYYYDLAQNFAISDRFFSSVIGPTFPNRSFLYAGTSFGHLVNDDATPPPGGYQPINGTIFDMLDAHHVSWANYFQDVATAASFRDARDHHLEPLQTFLAAAAGARGARELPAVSFVDPNSGSEGNDEENDEASSTDIQRGQAFVSQVIRAVRNGPHWKDSVIFVVYAQHGGAYDHVSPPVAVHPDGIAPGKCVDRSNVPASLAPGAGALCSENALGTMSSLAEAGEICAAVTADPTAPYPAACANFDQLGVRVPFIAVSPFSKRNHVSHSVADHTSILKFIETAFLPRHNHLTARDREANSLVDLFDFEREPSRLTQVGIAAPPVADCTPDHQDGPTAAH